MPDAEQTELYRLMFADIRKAITRDPQAVSILMVVAIDKLLIELGIYTKEQIAHMYNKLVEDRAARIADHNHARLVDMGCTVEQYQAARMEAEKMQSTSQTTCEPTIGQMKR